MSKAPILLPDPAKPKDRWRKMACRRLGSSCWIWTGAVTSKGYPSRHVKGTSRRGGTARTELAHRAMLAEHLGHPLPDGSEVHHRCERKLCVNPLHLEAVSRSEHRDRHADLAQKRFAMRWARIGHFEDLRKATLDART